MKHTTIDCYGASKYLLDDIKFINNLLNNIVYELDLSPVTPPQIIPYYYGKVREDVGVSAFILLEGGHITIHTFPLRECYFVDCLAKNDYNENELYKYLYKNLPFDEEKSMLNMCLRNKLDFITKEYNLSDDFGPHLMLELISNDFSIEKLYDFLEKIAYDINMDPITRPFVIKSTINNPKWLSGIIVIAQSHISVHYELKTERIYIDIFSCMPFDYSNIVTVMNNLGEIVSYYLICRGSKHVDKIKSDLELLNDSVNSYWQLTASK